MIFLRKIRSLFDPDQYQGWGNTRKYFEGWYFKVVNAPETKAFAFIPGIAMDEAGRRHAFIQVLDGMAKKSEYHTFEASLFVPSENKFDLSIGTNRFSAAAIELDLPSIKGSLRFGDLVRWPDKWYSPGIMGPYTFAPFMECNHGVVSMDHSLSGILELNGESVDFTGGRGYIEKDWGHSFPSAYVWIQTNHFSNPGISFKASVARVPWITGEFTGFIAGIWTNRQFIRFTTYNGSHLRKLLIRDDSVEMEMENHDYRFIMTATHDNTIALASPVRGLMDGRINESMTSEITLMLQDKRTGRTVLDDKGRNACIEISGEIRKILVTPGAR